MKKIYRGILFSVLLSLLLWGCSSVKEEPDPKESTFKEAEQNKKESQAALLSSFNQEGEFRALIPRSKGQEGIDFDLTMLNQNMVFAQIYSMIMSPEEYTGKTVKLKGSLIYAKEFDENGNIISDKEVLICVVSDEAACCAVGVEFIPKDEEAFRGASFEEWEEITITGVCDIVSDGTGFLNVVRLDEAQVEK